MNKYTIKPLSDYDIPKVTPMIEEFCKEMGFPYHYESVVQSILNGISSGWYQSIYEEDGKYLGLAGVLIAPYFSDFRSFQAIEFMWHSLPSLSEFKRAKIMIRLLNDMEIFAENKGLDLILSTSSVGKNKALGEYCFCHGYTQIEAVFRKEYRDGN